MGVSAASGRLHMHERRCDTGRKENVVVAAIAFLGGNAPVAIKPQEH